MDDDQVEAQDPTQQNSPKIEGSADDEVTTKSVAAADCYWNDKRYSDGGTVCDNGQRFKCWNGKWADIGNC